MCRSMIKALQMCRAAGKPANMTIGVRIDTAEFLKRSMQTYQQQNLRR